jgi:hypothetical protein
VIDEFLFKNELSTDTNGHESNENKKHIFGCADKETGEFFNQKADGIIGFGSEILKPNSSNPPNIIETEKFENRIKEKEFSLCFGHNGGELSFGGWNSWLHLENDDPQRFNVIETKSLGKYAWSSQYRVPVYSVDIEGEVIDYDYDKMNKGRSYGEGAFFDSGTTFIYVASDFFNKLKVKMENFCSKKTTNCGGQDSGLDCYLYVEKDYATKREFFDSFPMINFDFKAQKKYKLHPEDYLINIEDSEQYCVGIKTLKNMILGGVFWRNYDIKIDKTNQTVSFVRSDCDKSGNVRDKKVENKSTSVINTLEVIIRPKLRKFLMEV